MQSYHSLDCHLCTRYQFMGEHMFYGWGANFGLNLKFEFLVLHFSFTTQHPPNPATALIFFLIVSYCLLVSDVLPICIVIPATVFSAISLNAPPTPSVFWFFLSLAAVCPDAFSTVQICIEWFNGAALTRPEEFRGQFCPPPNQSNTLSALTSHTVAQQLEVAQQRPHTNRSTLKRPCFTPNPAAWEECK